MSNDLVVVDLSHWNEVDSFVEAKAGGLIGVIHKATEGTGYSDPDYKQRESAARAAGLGWGAYHFLKHGRAADQMAYFLDVIKAPGGMRIAIDYEDPACTLTDLHEAVRFLESEAPDLELAIYGGSLLKEQLGNSKDTLLSPYALWLAHYTSGTPSWPKGTWPVWTLWQYSDGSVGGQPRTMPGLVPPFDCNAFNGSRENCAKWFGLGVTPTPPEPPPAPDTVATVVEVALRIEIAADGTSSAVVTACNTVEEG